MSKLDQITCFQEAQIVLPDSFVRAHIEDALRRSHAPSIDAARHRAETLYAEFPDEYAGAAALSRPGSWLEAAV